MQTRVVVHFPTSSDPARNASRIQLAIRKPAACQTPSVPAALPPTCNSEQSWEKLAAASGYRPLQLAKLCQVSLRTLQRHFQNRYQTTVSVWLAEHRVNRAYHRIRSGESIKRVAYDLGFKQLSHFSRVFKTAYGVSPRALASPSPLQRLLTLDLPSARPLAPATSRQIRCE